MAHNRTTIRQALAAALAPLTFPTLVEHPGTRVDDADRPFALIRITDTDADSETMGASRTIGRTETVIIELHDQATDGQTLAEGIDAMELAVEGAIGADLTLGNTCVLVPVSSEVEYDFSQTELIGQRSLTYAAYWEAAYGSPDTPTPPQ